MSAKEKAVERHAQLFKAFKAALKPVLGNVDYLEGAPVSTTNPAVKVFLKSMETILEDGLYAGSTLWDFIEHLEGVTVAEGDTTAGEAMKWLKESSASAKEKARLWIMSSLNTHTFADAIGSMGDQADIKAAYYEPTAFLRGDHYQVIFSSSLSQLNYLTFMLDAQGMPQPQLPEEKKAKLEKKGSSGFWTKFGKKKPYTEEGPDNNSMLQNISSLSDGSTGSANEVSQLKEALTLVTKDMSAHADSLKSEIYSSRQEVDALKKIVSRQAQVLDQIVPKAKAAGVDTDELDQEGVLDSQLLTKLMTKDKESLAQRIEILEHAATIAQQNTDNQVKELEADITRLQAEVTSWKSHAEQFEGQCEEVQQKLEAERLEHEEKAKQVERDWVIKYEEVVSRQKLAKEMLTQELKARTVEIQNLEAQSKPQEANLELLRAELYRTIANAEELAQALEKEKQSNQELSEKCEVLETNVQSLKGSEEDSNNSPTSTGGGRGMGALLAQTQAELKGSKKELEMRYDVLCKMKDDLENAERRRCQAEDDLNRKSLQFTQLQSEAKTQREELDSLKAEAESGGDQVVALKATVEELKASEAKSASRIMQLERELKLERDMNETNYGSMSTLLEKERERAKQASETAAIEQKRMQKLTERINEMEPLFRSSEKQLKAKSSELDEERLRREAFSKRVLEVEGDLSTCKGQLALAEKTVMALEMDLEQMEEFKVSLQEAQSREATLRKSLDEALEAQKQIEALQQQIKNKEQEIEDIVQNHETEQLVLEGKLKDSESLKEALQDTLEKRNDEIVDLSTQLDEMECELDTLKADPLEKKCTQCGIDFTMTRRKHHCRACKKAACDTCAPVKAHAHPSLQQFKGKPTRVCKSCVPN